MNDDRWSAVDGYLAELLVGEDEALQAALAASREAGLPDIQVSTTQGKLLYLLARAAAARRILEIGTLAGYSAIWLARALPDGGRLVTLELEAKHAEVARRNLARAGVGERVDVVVGPAVESLRGLADAQAEPFDLVFIDADKETYPEYLDWSVRLTQSGSLIVADNVVRDGAIFDAGSGDSRVAGIRRFLEQLAEDERLESTVIQTVGSKGYDGLSFSRVR